MSTQILQAIEQICDEKGLPKDKVIETIEQALAAAYKKDNQAKDKNIKVEFDIETGGARVFDEKEVVEDFDLEPVEEKREALREQRLAAEEAGDTELAEKLDEEEKELPRFHAKSELMLSEAVTIKPDAAIGDIIRTEMPVTEEYGRMAAQTAKQVIIQRLREVERDIVFDEFQEQQGELINGVIQRQEGSVVLVDLHRTTGVMPLSDSVRTERYRPGSRMRFYVKEVRMGGKGPEVYLSRSHPEMIRKMFELEVPEITTGTVEIKAIAREAGARSKIAVFTDQDNIDPVGSCVGQRGTRVQTVINELGGEKIDIIEWDDDPAQFVAHALSPAAIINVELDEAEHRATVLVREDQLSLAIGKAGQNVRLAAKLTGWKIDIMSESGAVMTSDGPAEAGASAEVVEETPDSEEVAPAADEDTAEESELQAESVEVEQETVEDVENDAVA